MSKKTKVSPVIGLVYLVGIVYAVMVVNYYMNIKEYCNEDCHNDSMRSIILFTFLFNYSALIINRYKPLGKIMILVSLSALLNIITQFVYLRELNEKCDCKESLLRDVMTIANYIVSGLLFLLLLSPFIIFIMTKVKS